MNLDIKSMNFGMATNWIPIDTQGGQIGCGTQYLSRSEGASSPKLLLDPLVSMLPGLRGGTHSMWSAGPGGTASVSTHVPVRPRMPPKNPLDPQLQTSEGSAGPGMQSALLSSGCNDVHLHNDVHSYSDVHLMKDALLSSRCREYLAYAV